MRAGSRIGRSIIVSGISLAALDLLACGPCSGEATAFGVALEIRLSDASGSPVSDAAIQCWSDTSPGTEVRSPVVGTYQCGDRPGTYNLRITWHGSDVVSETDIVVPQSSQCGAPATVQLSFVVSPPNADGGVSTDTGAPTDAAEHD